MSMKIRKSRPDEINSSVTHIQVGGIFRPPSQNQPDRQTNAPSVAPEVTGFDYASQWPEELKIIHERGPFSPEELTRLSMEQIGDYYYVTSWFLRDVGEEKFVAARDKLRQFFLMRLEEGERLRPPI
jgi:hypothetical protein